jgi:hypothetical protein
VGINEDAECAATHSSCLTAPTARCAVYSRTHTASQLTGSAQYAYSNPSGSKYHDFGHGNSIFVAADGDVTHKFNWVEQPSSFAQKASAKAKALRAEDEKAMREAQERESHAQAVCKKELGVESEGEPQGAVEHKSAGEVKCEASAVDADSIASRVKKEER